MLVSVDVIAYPLIGTSAPGRNLLPVPQKTSLKNEYFSLTNRKWSVTATSNISKENAALKSLVNEIKERFGIIIGINHATAKNLRQPVIRMIIKEGSVEIGATTDTSREAIKKQAYRLKIDTHEISIIANAQAGLFYGVQTLLQLLTVENGNTLLPKGEITDWPDLEMRIIYWDDAHHLERPEAMKRILRRAAYYKINGFALKLEGHFQFASAAPIVEPYAYTPAEYQDLTNYAKQLSIELIPFLDAPSHVSFILKHPQYAGLRAYANNNYQFSLVNPGTQELVLKMFNELLDANKGGKYVFLSTDEAYYAGKPDNEKEIAKALGGNGKLLGRFISKLADALHKKGRNVLIWGEYPLEPGDISSLSSHIINGVYDKDVAHLYKQAGLRQMIYTSTQGVEPLFPSYYSYPEHTFAATDTATNVLKTDDEMQQGQLAKGRVDGVLSTISSAITNGRSFFKGVIIAGWGDSGLNPQTFWLGYASGASAGWNRQSVTAKELSDRFYRSFYGTDAIEMERVYEMLCSQAQFWNDSWEWAPLQLRTPIVGNSEGIFEEPRHLKDQTLLTLPVPAAKSLQLNKDWSSLNAQRLKTTEKFLQQNSELISLLHANLRNNNRQQYNLRILMSVAQLCRQNIQMLQGLGRINSFLQLSSGIAVGSPSAALSLLDKALDEAITIRNQRNEMLQSVISIWYEEWYPRVAEANGRVFLDKVDDVKDHVPIRTIDMSYLIYRQLNYPMENWYDAVKTARNQIASDNHPRNDKLDWKKTDVFINDNIRKDEE